MKPSQNDLMWLTNDGIEDPTYYVELDLGVTVEDVRRAIDEASKDSPHWCASCGKIDAAPICFQCEKHVWLKEGGNA